MIIEKYNVSGDLYSMIIHIIGTIPLSVVVLVWVLITMIAFYATSFNSITYTTSCYSYKKLKNGEESHKIVQLLWCIMLIILPIVLVFPESSMNNI